MRPVRILHCADLHLDSSFVGSGLGEQAAKLRAEELKETFARTVQLVRETEADLFLIAGDLWEHEYVRKSTAQFVIDQIRRQIPTVPVFIAPGNHDPLQRDSYYTLLEWPENVTIFGPAWRSVELEPLGVTVHGWGFDRPHVTDRHLRSLVVPADDRLHLALLHGSAEQFPSDEGVYLPLSREECLACGADYIALGHFHSHAVAAERKGTLAAYPGAPESLTFGQRGEHGVLVGTVGKEGNRLRLERVGLRRHLSLEVPMTGVQSLEGALEAIRALIPPAERSQNLCRIRLVGERDPDLDLDPALVTARLAQEFYSIQVQDRTEAALDLEQMAIEQSLRGRFVKAMLLELEGAAEPEQDEIRLALAHGLRALEGRRQRAD